MEEQEDQADRRASIALIWKMDRQSNGRSPALQLDSIDHSHRFSWSAESMPAIGIGDHAGAGRWRGMHCAAATMADWLACISLAPVRTDGRTVAMVGPA